MGITKILYQDVVPGNLFVRVSTWNLPKGVVVDLYATNITGYITEELAETIVSNKAHEMHTPEDLAKILITDSNKKYEDNNQRSSSIEGVKTVIDKGLEVYKELT